MRTKTFPSKINIVAVINVPVLGLIGDSFIFQREKMDIKEQGFLIYCE